MSAVVQSNALALPLRDESIDLIVTSPPYFGQRRYEGGDAQIGAEPTPAEFLGALWQVMHECWRVLKPQGVAFVNLGDKRSGSGAPGTTSGLSGRRATGKPVGLPGAKVQGERSGMAGGYTREAFGRAKSKQLLPHRFAIGCEDGLADPDGIGWIVRQDMVWAKPNGMPESVTDRTRDNHEYWFHLTKQGDYYSAIDEIRGPVSDYTRPNRLIRTRAPGQTQRSFDDKVNPAGALPSAVWEIPTQPLVVPEYLGVEHFAAFPTEWPRRLVLAFSPPGICTECGEGRRLISEKPADGNNNHDADRRSTMNLNGAAYYEHAAERARSTVTRLACACPDAAAPTLPAVVLDPFGGTGTTAMVARALGRTGVSCDLSADYCRVARWRIFESGHNAKVESRTNGDRQGTLI